MLLRNYDNIMTAFRITNFLSNTAMSIQTDTEVFGDGHINVAKGTSIFGIYFKNNARYVPFSWFGEKENKDSGATSYGESVLIVGSGDKTESYDDTELAEIISSDKLGQVTGSSSFENTYDENLGVWISTYKRSFVAKEKMTIREIGVIYGMNVASASVGVSLVYRKVLDIPVEVESGASFVVSFTQTISANPNKPADYDASVVVAE